MADWQKIYRITLTIIPSCGVGGPYSNFIVQRNQAAVKTVWFQQMVLILPNGEVWAQRAAGQPSTKGWNQSLEYPDSGPTCIAQLMLWDEWPHKLMGQATGPPGQRKSPNRRQAGPEETAEISMVPYSQPFFGGRITGGAWITVFILQISQPYRMGLMASEVVE